MDEPAAYRTVVQALLEDPAVSETLMMGTAAEELLGLYLMSGLRVLVLGSRPGDEIPRQLVRLPRGPHRDQLLASVRALTGS